MERKRNPSSIKGNKKIIGAWALYDWANSSYSLVITSSLFPIYFHSITTGNGTNSVKFLGRAYNSDSLQTYAISIAFLVIAALNPLLSSIADYSGKKKKFMFFFSTLGACACASLFFFDSLSTLWIGVLGSILAAIGYAGSIVFYNAFLPEIASPPDQDKVSAKGFAMGYIGSSLLLIFSLTMIMFPEWYGGISKGMATRLAFLLVGLWWFGFAQYTFYHLPDNVYNRKPKGRYIFNGYLELKKVWKELKHSSRLKNFLLSFFFYNMGVQTVMYVATLFGDGELHLPATILIVVILIIQFVAIAGAYLFSGLSGRYGNLNALTISMVIWILICIGAWFCDRRFGINEQTMFIILAAFVGLVMGGIQSLSRSTYSKLLPETIDHASYFSFYDVSDKLGTVLGTFLFGYINEVTGSMRNSIIVLISFFLLGLILLLRIKEEQPASLKGTHIRI
ncbi:MAG: MFS transporter [Bacteroidia bacterium]|nr:MFS transporter [Bacteroidia bacterium]